MDKISVIIPAYNREKRIERSVRSVLEQTCGAMEILVVDDGSSDGTAQVIERMGESCVRCIRLTENGGASGARNEGARQAKGELIAFQDSDDCWRPDKLERQMTYWEKHPECSMVCGSYLYHMGDGRTIKVPENMMKGETEEEIFSSLLLRNSVGTPTMLIKRDCFLQSGGFDTGLRSLEDWEFALRFSREHRIGFLSDILVDAWQTEGGVSSNAAAYYESRCRMIGRYKDDLMRLGLFDQAAGDVLARAQRSGVLPNVQKMLMICLRQVE